jgi:8-oxo-dGTP pyrophosphatase MutT (NUDIX family)
MKICSQENFFETIEEILRQRSPNLIPDSEGAYRRAGVLVPLLRENGTCSILFTKRTNRVKTHKGQISFPGGAVDEEDRSPEETALREAHEEIGLAREHVRMLGRMDDTLTVASNFVIHPFVGLVLHANEFILNKAEVERLIKVPLDHFQPENLASEACVVRYAGKTYRSPSYNYDGEVIWGATAKIVKRFMELIHPKLILPTVDK